MMEGEGAGMTLLLGSSINPETLSPKSQTPTGRSRTAITYPAIVAQHNLEVHGTQ